MELFGTPLFSDANLVHYYRMEGNSNDSKGSANGVDTGITYSPGNGKYGQGAGFNGTTSDIDFATFSSDIFASGGTMSGWINLNAVANGKIIVQFDDGNKNRIDLVNTSGSTCSLEFQQFCSVTDGIWRTTNRDISTGQWIHIAITYDRSGGVGANPIIYINGVSVAVTTTQSPVAPLRTGITQVNLGSDGFGAAFINGAFDDFAFFNRVLTAAEIFSLFVGQSTITLDATSSADTTQVSPKTLSHVVGNFNNLGLIVGIQTIGVTDQVTAVTYNGKALTRIDTAVSTGGNRVYLYHMENPDPGTHNISVSYSGGSQEIILAAASYYNVSQSGQPTQESPGSNDSGTSLNITNITTIDNSLHIGFFTGFNFAASAGANTTLVVSPGVGFGLYKATALVSPPGSSTIGITSSSDQHQGVAAVFSPFLPPTGAPFVSFVLN